MNEAPHFFIFYFILKIFFYFFGKTTKYRPRGLSLIFFPRKVPFMKALFISFYFLKSFGFRKCIAMAFYFLIFVIR